jgi:hypothetical protein
MFRRFCLSPNPDGRHLNVTYRSHLWRTLAFWRCAFHTSWQQLGRHRDPAPWTNGMTAPSANWEVFWALWVIFCRSRIEGSSRDQELFETLMNLPHKRTQLTKTNPNQLGVESYCPHNWDSVGRRGGLPVVGVLSRCQRLYLVASDPWAIERRRRHLQLLLKICQQILFAKVR